VSIELFRDDDQGYATWLAANAQGYVLNIQRTLTASDARVHRADCRTITGTPPRGRAWTEAYIKVCALSLPELDAWALTHARSAITRCGTCQPLPLTRRPFSSALCSRPGRDAPHSADYAPGAGGGRWSSAMPRTSRSALPQPRPANRVQALRTAVGVRAPVCRWAWPVPARNPHIRQTDWAPTAPLRGRFAPLTCPPAEPGSYQGTGSRLKRAPKPHCGSRPMQVRRFRCSTRRGGRRARTSRSNARWHGGDRRAPGDAASSGAGPGSCGRCRDPVGGRSGQGRARVTAR